MAKRITYVTVCVLAVILTGVALTFVGVYNAVCSKSVTYTDNSDTIKLNTTRYEAIVDLQSFPEGQALLDKFLSAKIEDIGSQAKPGKFYKEITEYVDKHQAICEKDEKLAKDFFSYVNMLKSVKKEKFSEFKSNFPRNMLSITVDGAGEELTFGKEYVTELKKVNSYDEMVTYINEELSPKYKSFKKEQLDKAEQLKNVATLLTMVDDVYKLSAYDKEAKAKELETLQSRINQYQAADSSLTTTFGSIFILFVIAIVATAIFIIYTIITRFHDYRIIMVVAGIFLILFIVAWCSANAWVPTDLISIPSFVNNGVTSSLATFIHTIVVGALCGNAGAIIYLLVDLIVSFIKRINHHRLEKEII